MPSNNFNWFSKYFVDLKDVEQQNVLCIFHDEENPSLSINLKRGLYHCHTCGAKGDIYSLVMAQEHCSFTEAKHKVIGDARVSVLSESEVFEAHNYLLKHKYLHTMLFTHRGWLLDTIIKFKLGWNEKEKRVQIPVYDDLGNLKNIRKYLVGGKATRGNPKFRGIRGHNENYFFPIKNLMNNKFIMIMAGEPDTIIACQLGFNAGTFTAGEGAFNRDLLPLFKDKLVYICYDKDPKGLGSLKTLGPAVARYAKETRIIDLPF